MTRGGATAVTIPVPVMTIGHVTRVTAAGSAAPSSAAAPDAEQRQHDTERDGSGRRGVLERRRGAQRAPARRRPGDDERLADDVTDRHGAGDRVARTERRGVAVAVRAAVI